MKMFRIKFSWLLVVFLATCGSLVMAQQNVTTFGISFKPMVPWSVAQTGPVLEFEDEAEFEVAQEFGYSFGMVVRHGFTKNISFETGINAVQRNFNAAIRYPDLNYTGSTEFRLIGYEIPTQALVYVRLSENWYMNGAFGLSLDLYPSNVAAADSGMSVITARTSWLQTALLANVGWEYRTQKSGYFYIGGSYHRPFSTSYTALLELDERSTGVSNFIDLSGNYLTLDFRYFFHEDPEKREKKPKKLKKSERSLWNQRGR